MPATMTSKTVIQSADGKVIHPDPRVGLHDLGHRRRRPDPLKIFVNGLPEDADVVAAGGVLLELARRFPPVASFLDPGSRHYDPAEYERIMRGHERRVGAETARLAAGGRGNHRASERRSAPAARKYLTPDWLRVCNCSGCRRLLTAREQLVPESVDHGYVKKLARSTPPVVAGRVDGRPYCAACLGRGENRQAPDRPVFRRARGGKSITPVG